jgi:sugar lactone lactonase YvrE
MREHAHSGASSAALRLRSATAIVSILALSLVMAFVPPAQAQQVSVVVSFDPAAGQLPEGLTTDNRGNFYVSFVAPLSQILEIRPDGSESVVANLGFGGLGPLGLATDASGRVYVCASTFDPATRGIYRLSADGSATRLPGTGSILFPNGMAFDRQGNLYVADSIGGTVWKVPRAGSAELWAQSPLLEGNGALNLGFPIGANGIAMRDHSFVVTNTEQAQLVRIPVQRDGSAGDPTVLLNDPALFGADGLAIDAFGRIDVAVIVQSTIVQVDGDSIQMLADATDGINQASSLAFGTGADDHLSLYAVNFGVFTSAPTPALLQIPVGVPGRPLP